MIKDFKAGEKISEPVILRLQKIGTSSTGSPFARGLIEDNSGCIPFVCFDANIVEKLRGVDITKPCVVGGNIDINKYASDMSTQLILQKLDKLGPNDSVSHLMPNGNIDLLAYKKKVDEFLEDIKDEGLKKLAQNILSGETYEQFLINPAGMRLHHAYVGGLMHHSVSVTELALSLAHTIGGVDRDLVLTGALLHDVGKIVEISSDLGYPYTTEGRLLGHISIFAMRLYEEGRKVPELSKEKLDELLHIILSHHGEQAKGSPMACATKEAFIVHYADEIDAIMNQFEGEKKPNNWDYNKMLQRFILIK